MQTKEIEIGGRKLKFTTEYLARQANGSVLVQYGDTVVLATVTMSGEKKDLDFLPLFVEYEERLYAAGKIKGSRFIKREGKPTDEAILSGRVIDRGIRPLFDQDMRNEVQVVATVLSVDEENDSDVVAANAVSAALSISDIPWDGPLATVRVGKVDGEYVINPTYDQRDESTLDLVVSSTGDHIIMVEAGASQVTEEEIVEGIKFAQKYFDQLIEAQNSLVKEFGKPKAEVSKFTVREEILEKAKEVSSDIEKALYEASEKEDREERLDELKENFVVQIEEGYEEDETAVKEASVAFDKVVKEIIRTNIFENEKRVDGRPLSETRTVSAEVGVLPRTHGSAVFQRGETQVLTTVTLGSPGEEQILDGMEDFGDVKKRYIHHYNFPPYSVGEVWPMRGPKRREIGHGALAERALEPVIPTRDEFPYTMRLVSEVMGSNGSTSMASTCGSSLALMDAGVPVKATIGGVAMGLVLDTESGNSKVLTDIAGIEDANGDMDFKITGSEVGVTALQMDVKARGLTVDILEKALEQAREGRLHIIKVMDTALAGPREELNKYAPRITSFKIDPKKIGDVIGSGGKTINEIIDETGVKIDIEDDGLVMISSTEAEGAKRAEEWVKNLVKEPEPGEEYKGRVTRIMDFGAFVEILPGKEGLVHISKLAPERVNKVEDVVKEGDEIDVIVSEIDNQGRINLITKEAKAAGKSGRRDQNNRGRKHKKRGR